MMLCLEVHVRETVTRTHLRLLYEVNPHSIISILYVACEAIHKESLKAAHQFVEFGESLIHA